MNWMRKIGGRTLLATLLIAPSMALADQTWDFRVFLDEKEIGTHRFEGTQRVDGCVLTFAYWNPEMLGQAQLLNSQDGQIVK
jgi:hypothetical protein